MIKATVNGGAPLSIETGAKVYCNDTMVDWSARKLPAGNYSILMDGRSYTAQVLKIDREARMVTLEIAHQRYEVAIEEPIDQLLAAMGIKDALAHKLNDIKAPMPGLVLKILVEPGQSIRKGGSGIGTGSHENGECIQISSRRYCKSDQSGSRHRGGKRGGLNSAGIIFA